MICTRIYPGIQRINTDICNITIEPSLKYANKNHVNRYINKVYVSTKKKKMKCMDISTWYKQSLSLLSQMAIEYIFQGHQCPCRRN